MTGLDNIIRKIKEDADALVMQIKEETLEEAEQILADARVETEKKRQEMLERAKNAGLLRQERIVSMAKLDGNKAILKAKRDLMDKAFNGVRKLLETMPDDEYESLLTRIIIKTNPKSSGVILLNPADMKRVSDKFIKEINKTFKKQDKKITFTLEKGSEKQDRGFILVCGNIEINGSFDKMMEMRKGEFENILSETLFAD